MIRLICTKCGHKLRAADQTLCKRGKCPFCQTVNRIKPSADPDPAAVAKALLTCSDKSTIDIELPDKLYYFFNPTYDELTLFLTSVTVILLYLADGPMHRLVNHLLFARFKELFLPLILFLSGFTLSFYRIFIKRDTSDVEKCLMFFFVVVANIFAAFAAGLHMFRTSFGWTVIFPIWNIIIGIILLCQFRFGFFDEYCITDDKPPLLQLLFSVSLLSLVFCCCQYIFKLHWSITFSICSVYITTIDNIFQPLCFGGE